MGGKREKDSHWSSVSLLHGKIRVKTHHQTNIISLQLQSGKDHLFTSTISGQSSLLLPLEWCYIEWTEIHIEQSSYAQNNCLSSWPRDPHTTDAENTLMAPLKSLKGSIFQSKDEAHWKMSTHHGYFNKQKMSDLALSVLDIFEALGVSFFYYISDKVRLPELTSKFAWQWNMEKDIRLPI